MKIYLTKNLVNGKIYIGQKQDNAPKHYIGGGAKLSYAIKKYGKHNFSHSIILHCEDSQSDAFEQLYIWWYSSQEDSVGYNIQAGGSPSSTEITRARMKTSRKGIVFSEEHRANLSKAQIGRIKTETTIEKWRESRNGFKQTDEAKAKISSTQVGGKKSKSVCKIDPLSGEILAVYRGGFALSADGYNQSKVSACALGKRKMHKGFFWKYENS